MKTHTRPTPLSAALLLTLLLAACGGPTRPAGTPVTSLADSGPGSLREVLAAAGDGDTLRFTAGGTVTLSSPVTIDKDVTILAGEVTLDAAGRGRVLEVAPGTEVTMRGGTLRGGVGQPVEIPVTTSQALSRATWGGNLLNGGTLTLDGTTVTGGRAMNGGGIYNAPGATLTLRNVTMTANEAFIPNPDIASESTGSGGAIANRGTLTIESGTFQGNVAFYTGGVLRHTDGTLTVQGGLFENNSCTFAEVADGSRGCAGGAMLLSAGTVIGGGTFRGNSATNAGGALFVSRSAVTISGGTFEGNRATGAVNSSGGAIYSTGNLTLSAGTFRGNAALYGGALRSSGSSTLTMTGGSFTGNAAGATGGAVNFYGTGRISGGVIENNAAQSGGGGLQLYSGAGQKTSLTIEGGAVVRGNTAQYGGGIGVGSAEAGGTTLEVRGGTLSGNSAQRGGGLDIGHSAILNLSGGTISGNQATVTGGGIVIGGAVTMTGGTISGNSTVSQEGHEGGGGVRLYAGAKMTASGGTISGNKARWGAGVVIDGPYQTSPTAEFLLTGADVSGNQLTDPSNVGGGFFNGGRLTVTSGRVTGNAATRNGGGVFNRKDAAYIQTGGTVSGNTPDNVFNE
ncbi:beta strand repeat-containing protein [Deinococcus terrestris]|nr:hypothetical protein [Deinococcus terrestris]